MLKQLTTKEQVEFCQLLIIAFYESWDESEEVNADIHKKAFTWIENYAHKRPPALCNRILAIVGSIRAKKWLRGLMSSCAEKAASPFSSPAEVEAARTKLLSIVTTIDESGTSDDELVVSRMCLD